MKKIILFSMLLIVSASSFSQQINSSAALTKQDYLQKSKKQKTAAWLLLGSGTVMMITGSIIWSNAVEETITNDPIGIFYAPYTTTKGTGLTAAGLLVSAGSIPLFIASGKNKRKAMNASAFFKMETIPVIQRPAFVPNTYPAVSLKIGL